MNVENEPDQVFHDVVYLQFRKILGGHRDFEEIRCFAHRLAHSSISPSEKKTSVRAGKFAYRLLELSPRD